MRGMDQQQDGLFSYLSLESRIPPDYPLRAARHMVGQVLAPLPPLFDTLYAAHGHASIPPERLLRAQMLQIFLRYPLQTPSVGADRFQPAVSVIRWAALG